MISIFNALDVNHQTIHKYNISAFVSLSLAYILYILNRSQIALPATKRVITISEKYADFIRMMKKFKTNATKQRGQFKPFEILRRKTIGIHL